MPFELSGRKILTDVGRSSGLIQSGGHIIMSRLTPFHADFQVAVLHGRPLIPFYARRSLIRCVEPTGTDVHVPACPADSQRVIVDDLRRRFMVQDRAHQKICRGQYIRILMRTDTTHLVKFQEVHSHRLYYATWTSHKFWCGGISRRRYACN